MTAGPLDLEFTTGRRTALGVLLRAVPRPLATAPAWITVVDVVARRVLPGVRTRGSAGRGRREYYAALDVQSLAGARITWEGADRAALRRSTRRCGSGSARRRRRRRWCGS